MLTPVPSILLGFQRWLVSRRSSRFARYRASDVYRRDRRDVRRIDGGPGLEFEVFWKKITGVGRGPACSVVVAGEEVLRLDCFGPGDGHLHADFFMLAPEGEERLFFGEDTVPAQIERAVFEIKRNLPYYTARSRWPPARDFKADPVRLEAALAQVRTTLLEFSSTAVADS
jgi:hypothetical protein